MCALQGSSRGHRGPFGNNSGRTARHPSSVSPRRQRRNCAPFSCGTLRFYFFRARRRATQKKDDPSRKRAKAGAFLQPSRSPLCARVIWTPLNYARPRRDRRSDRVRAIERSRFVCAASEVVSAHHFRCCLPSAKRKNKKPRCAGEAAVALPQGEGSVCARGK